LAWSRRLFLGSHPQRGLDFAIETSSHKQISIEKPAVVGAVIDLGLCLDLTTLGAIEMVKTAYLSLKTTFATAGKDLPKNASDRLLRRLDCAVIQHLHTI